MKFKAFLFSLLVLVAIGQSSSVAQEALEAYWAFDEGGGNVLLDSSGNGRDGTIMDNFQWIPGVFGSALQMNGVNGQRIEVAGYDGILGTSDRTVVAWINTTAVGDIISFMGGEHQHAEMDISRSNGPGRHRRYSHRGIGWLHRGHHRCSGRRMASRRFSPGKQWRPDDPGCHDVR